MVLGGVHGDETCGTVGIERVVAELDAGALQLLRGQLTMVPVANPLARRLGRREGERNLNRLFRPSRPGVDAGRLRRPHHRPAVPAARPARGAARPAFLPERGRGLRDDRPARQHGHARALRARLRGRPARAAPGHAARGRGLARHLCRRARAARRRTAGRRCGAGLRLGHQRIHAQPRRLRRHARMRPARGPGRARGGLPRRSWRRCACWA